MFGLHLIDKFDDGLGFKGCYFLEKPHGNYVFFSSHMRFIDKDFITSKGGIFKQYEHKESPVTNIQKELFRYYGAPKLLNIPSQMQEIKVEQDGIDFYDHHIVFDNKGFIIHQRRKKIILLSPEYFLDRGVIRTLSNFKEFKLQENYDGVFATYFRGSNHYLS